MEFEWDGAKARSNRSKHGIDFNTASLVFDDPFHVTDEPKFVRGEERWLTVGWVENIIMIAVVHTYRGTPPGEVIRIISARQASRRERKQYEQAFSKRTEALGGSGRSTR